MSNKVYYTVAVQDACKSVGRDDPTVVEFFGPPSISLLLFPPFLLRTHTAIMVKKIVRVGR